jgi:hypothetical protein
VRFDWIRDEIEMINDSQLENLLAVMHNLSIKANEVSDLREKNEKLETKISSIQYDNDRLREQIKRLFDLQNKNSRKKKKK